MANVQTKNNLNLAASSQLVKTTTPFNDGVGMRKADVLVPGRGLSCYLELEWLSD